MPAFKYIDKLEAMLSVIKQNPKHWEQGSWRRGTSYCAAGWLCVLDGATPKKPEPTLPCWDACGYDSLADYIDGWPSEGEELAIKYGTMPGENTDDVMVWPDGTERSISGAAHKLLGDDVNMSILFAGHNTLKDLEDMVDHLRTHESLSDYVRLDAEES